MNPVENTGLAILHEERSHLVQMWTAHAKVTNKFKKLNGKTISSTLKSL